MTYETVVKATGGQYEAVVTLSGMPEPLTAREIAQAKVNVTASFRAWFGSEPETVAVVANCPVQESDEPGRMSD